MIAVVRSHFSAPRTLLAIVLGAGVFGFAIGASKNFTYAWRSMVKLPLLLLGTAAICSLACFVLARFLGAPLRFAAVQRSTLQLYRTIAVLLASLSPVSFFLGQSMTPPDGHSLGGYPTFVATNVLFLAVAGCIALVLQARALLDGHGLSQRRAWAITASWLVLSLLVGGQLAFWLRPFFGIASLPGDPPFALGDEPTITGARNFYEAVWQFVRGVELPR